MYELQIFYQRNRRLLLRVAMLTPFALGGLLVLMPTPRAEGSAAGNKLPASMAILMSPHRLESGAFVSDFIVALR